MRQVSSGELDIAIIAAGEENSRLNFLELECHPLFALMQIEGRRHAKASHLFQEFSRSSMGAIWKTCSPFDARFCLLPGRRTRYRAVAKFNISQRRKKQRILWPSMKV
jgi:hypothetical protein